MQSSPQSHSHPQHQQELPVVPHFLPNLRLALAVLYSLPLPDKSQQLPSTKQAHDFLIHIQSRNARRKIRSAQQKQRDLQNKQQHATGRSTHSINDGAMPIIQDGVDIAGSSWLACLAILCQVHHHHPNSFVASSTERLFAAQTLLHRLRRVPVTDAVDIEMEHQKQAWDNHHSAMSYRMWMRHLHPTIANVLDTYHANCHPHHHHVPQQPEENSSLKENIVKAELTLLTLAAVSFYMAAENHNQVGPLLSTTLSAMATAALKLRHSNPCYSAMTNGTGSSASSSSSSNENTHSSTAVVILIRDAVGAVWNQVSPLYGEESHSCLRTCLYVCLGAIPDTVLGNPGGVRGRLSMDPRLIQTAIRELRTLELPLMWQVIVEQQQQQLSSNDKDDEMIWILRTCKEWARFLPLPAELVQHTVPQIAKYMSNTSAPAASEHQKVALSYLLALVESASWTVDQVLVSCLGLSESRQNQQAKKKRQSSRSKRRTQEVIDRETSDDSRALAEAEVQHRGNMACHAVLIAWEPLNAAAHEAIAAGAVDDTRQADGEGPIGCVAACASSCLSHILRHPDTLHGLELFRAVTDLFQLICMSPNSTIRALSFEPLFSLHSCLVDVVRTRGPLGDQLESLVVDHFSKCSLSLASACGYPSNYFDNLSAQSDEDIEIERNDIREILRTVGGSGELGSTSGAVSTHRPISVTTAVLWKILQSCNDAVCTASQLFPETAAHALSSLAKPLNFLAKCSLHGGGSDPLVDNLLDLATAMLCRLCESTIHAFQHKIPVSKILPLARIVNIAIASLSPMVAARCSILKGRENSETSPNLGNLLHLVFEVSILSIEHLPELSSESTLGHSMYDIRGTMRGPGGEDHVGCLTIMRISKETPELTVAVVDSIAPFIPRLCKLHQQLKTAEHERGIGVFHGTGVTPVSRRILLGTLCHLELVSQGRAGAASILEELFRNAVNTIASCGSRNSFDEATLYQMTEATFDLASFSTIASSLFTALDHEKTACLEAMTRTCIIGYQHCSTSSGDVSEAAVQWNRLRAGMFQLLRVASTSDIPERAAEILRACIIAECEAVQRQCSAGPQSPSSIFNDEIVSPESVPAGIFVRVVGEVLLRKPMELRANCLRVLTETKDLVIRTITSPCSDPHCAAFVDPRPALTEAWFQATVGLSRGVSRDSAEELLLVDTCVAAISLVFYPGMGKTEAERRHDPGMSPDGPQSLEMTALLVHFFQLGPTALDSISHRLSALVHIDAASIQELSQEPTISGVSILGAALFRAVQGAMPPWAVESIPELYSALFCSLGKDPSRFGLFLRVSMEVRLSSQVSFCSVDPGQLLSGPCFQGMSDVAKNDFCRQAVGLCQVNDKASWRRIKFLVKQICGGKKKETDFNQKPSLTRWEFTRL